MFPDLVDIEAEALANLRMPKGLLDVDLAQRTSGPNQLGFDYSLELPSGMQHSPVAFYENHRWAPLANSSVWTILGPDENGYSEAYSGKSNQLIGDSNWNSSQVGPILAEKAQSYIMDRNVAEPFFIYYCTQAVHAPHTPPVELDGIPIAGTTVNAHTDMVRELDAQVGVLIKALRKIEVYDRTLFIFLSDNGGLQSPLFLGEEAASYDSTNGWREEKGSIFEGGHRIPFIARWPGVIPPNSRSSELVSGLDIFATIAAITQQQQSPAAVVDSINLLPLLKQSDGAKGHDVLLHVAYGSSKAVALRQGNWKLHATYKRIVNQLGETKIENVLATHLFNLDTNPTETLAYDCINDTAPEQVQRVVRMVEALYTHVARATSPMPSTTTVTATTTTTVTAITATIAKADTPSNSINATSTGGTSTGGSCSCGRRRSHRWRRLSSARSGNSRRSRANGLP
jgi:arylsulfatase A-like enzyme